MTEKLEVVTIAEKLGGVTIAEKLEVVTMAEKLRGVTMEESEYKNSGGYFRFPDTGEDITADTLRATTCKSGDKWVQPAVRLNDGSIVKISGRCWNGDERACYKEYRNKGSQKEQGHSHVKQDSKPKKEKRIKDEVENVPIEDRELVKYDEASAISQSTHDIIKKCNEYIGVIKTQGLTCSLLSIEGTRKIYSIPFASIPPEEMQRLCEG